MTIKNTNTKITKTKFKVFTVTSVYKGSWTDVPYFWTYTLNKRVFIKLWKIPLFNYKAKFTDYDYNLIKSFKFG
jgi:hypothetical protein